MSRQGKGTPLGPDGLSLYSGFFDECEQRSLLKELEAVLEGAPPFVPHMPRTNRPFSVRMSNCGRLGWVSDVTGYRYQATHPQTGRPWPAIPERLRALWSTLGAPSEPEACLINLYDRNARMGLHQDADENTFAAPVLSVSLGASAVFRYGGLRRRDPTRSVRLHSGDVVVMGGKARKIYHGIDRVIAGSSRVIPDDERINITMRRVNPFNGADDYDV